MKVLVTGATGFIGKELIKKLNANGHEILVLTRNSDAAKFHIPVHCEIVTWDPEKYSLSPSILKGVDAVINLAGEGIADGRWTPQRKRALIQSRMLSARRLIDAMSYMINKPKVFLSASAIGFYGNQGNELLNEESAKGNGFLSKVCENWENEYLGLKTLGQERLLYELEWFSGMMVVLLIKCYLHFN